MGWKEACVILWIILMAAVMLGVFLTIPGCNGNNGKILGIFGSPTSGDGPGGVIDDGKESLFNAVKGTNWLVTLAIVGMAAGVFAFINGSKIGIAVIVSSAAALFMSLAVARFALWMAVFGMVGAVAVVAISILVKNKALKEIVGNVNAVKEIVGNGGGQLAVCDDVKTALLKQTKSTQKLVNKIRAKL